MIRHVVMFRFKAEATESDRAAMAEGLGSLPGKVPVIRNWSQGANVISSDRNYDFCLVGDYDSRQDLDAYQVHPAHQQVVQSLIRPNVESVVVVDYEI